jgi:serine protease inhibitor
LSIGMFSLLVRFYSNVATFLLTTPYWFKHHKTNSMKKTLILTFAIAFFAFAQSCNKSDNANPKKEPVAIQLSEKSEKLVQNSSDFGIELFKAIENTEKLRVNWMISPLSVSFALAMTYNGANEDTKLDMENTLRLNGLTTEEINAGYKQLSELLLDVDNNVDISIANSIWYRNTFTVLQDFITTNQQYYNAEVNALDFSDANGAKDIINNWVAENTNDKIESIVDQIDPGTVMFLINAIYFKGAWKYTFDESENVQLPFTNYADYTESIEMMTQTTDLRNYRDEEITMVELPYGQGNWVMDLMLPASDLSTNQLILSLTKDKWETWVNNLSEPVETTLTFPPFKFEYEETLNGMLASMGMGVAFSDQADFSKINGTGGLQISEVKHKTFIEVNEQGTEAAAVTSVGMELTSIGGGGIVFNKPFLFVIREQVTGTILFIGKVGNPER